MRHSQVSAVVAAGDTVKTSIGSITLTAKARRIVGLGGYAVGGAGLTTLENVTGILEFESSDLSIAPQQYPLDCVALVTQGVGAFSPRVWPMDIPVSGGEVLTAYVTMDMAQTIGNTCRWFVITEE